MDVFSKSIVGWACYEEESSVHASELMQDICWRENIKPQQVTLHSDNGGPMKGSTMLAMLQQLGVTPSFSRPAVSNDNPYSEALFKTLKYRPDNALKSFADVASASAWVERFVNWYQHEHRHSAIRFVTPAQRHAGLDRSILARRESVYVSARLRHPERWTNGTRNWKPVTVVHLNPEKTEEFIAVKTDHHFTVAKAA
jgi:transposase InsO family protein